MISRRTFLERMGFGAGAGLLAPITNSLLAHAQGMPPKKRLLVFHGGCGWELEHFTPPELLAQAGNAAALTAMGSTFTLPPMFRSLQPFKNRLMLLDGFNNSQHPVSGGIHSASFSALSCVPPTWANEENSGAGGITFDQHLASLLPEGYPYRSIGLGAVPDNVAERSSAATALARGRELPVPHLTSPKVALKQIFGAVVTNPNDPAEVKKAQKRRLLFDHLKTDLHRLESRVAGAERSKLDEYLGSLEAVEKRAMAMVPPGCRAPRGPYRDGAYPDTGGDNTKLQCMTELASAILSCGLSPIVTLNAFTGPDFNTWGYTQVPGVQTHTLAHQQGLGLDGLDLVHDVHASMIAAAATGLSRITEGNGTALDNTLIVFANDNGHRHHNGHARWPVVLLGNLGGAFHMDGRYVKLPLVDAAHGGRALADLYRTIETQFTGMPSGFASASRLAPTGPVTELIS